MSNNKIKASIKNRMLSVIVLMALLLSFMPNATFAEPLRGWAIVNEGRQDFIAVADTDVKYSGNASMAVSYKTMGGTDVYGQIRQYISVKKNTNYTYGMWIKADRIGNVHTAISWGQRYHLNSLGSTFDWRYYEFAWFSGDNTTAELQITFDTNTKKLYIDDVFFKETGTDTNLVANPGFEEDVVVEGETGNNGNIGDKNSNIDVADVEFGMYGDSKLDSLFIDSRILPVNPVSNIKIDGNVDDWEDKISLSKDNNGIASKIYTGYDEQNFYMACVVDDDVHFANTYGNDMWSRDNVTLCLGEEREDYGKNIATSFEVDGPLKMYSEQVHGYVYNQMETYGRRIEGKTFYEYRIPWSAINLDYKNDVIQISFLIGDHDNTDAGLKITEYASGISTTSRNEDFFTAMFMTDDTKSIDGIAMPMGIETDKNYIGQFVVYNNSNEDMQVKLPQDLGATEIKLIPGQFAFKEFATSFADGGANTITKAYEINGETHTVQRLIPNVERSEERVLADRKKYLEEYIPELQGLLEKCKEKKIPVTYEEVYVYQITKNLELIDRAFEVDAKYQAHDVLERLDNIYEETKSNLNGYLNGTKKAREAYQYVTSDIVSDGTSIMADVKNVQTGEVDRRPVYLQGMAGFEKFEMADFFVDLGYNNISLETGMDRTIKDVNGTNGWDIIGAKDKTTIEMVYEDETKNNSMLKITSETDIAPNQYKQIWQKYKAKPNTVYEYGIRVKAEETNGLSISVNGWNSERKYMDEGTYDWKDYVFEYETAADAETLEFFVIFEGKAKELYIDNLFVREKGTTTNLLYNGEFEVGRNVETYYGMFFDKSALDAHLAFLDKCAEKNISVGFQIATHYWPWFTTAGDPSAECAGSFTANLNYSHEKVRLVTEYYLKNLLELIKDKPAIDNLILGNEPCYVSLNNPGYYEPLWKEWLIRKYSNDINALNKVYGSQYSSFDEVTFDEVKQGDTNNWMAFGYEMGDKDKTPIFYDWTTFNNEQYADWVAFMYNVVKKYAPDMKISIKQLAGTWRYDHNYFRMWTRNGVKPESIAPFTDYNGCDAQGVLNNEEQSLQTKMRWYDYLTSIDEAPVYNSEDHVIRDDCENRDPNFAPWCGSTIWQSAVHGCPMVTSWVWAPDFEKGWGVSLGMSTRPDVMKKQVDATLDLNRLAWEMKALNDADAKVAVMDAFSSEIADKVFENVSFNAWQSSMYNGQRTDFVTEKQAVEGKLGRYKLVIIPKCDRVSPETLYALKAYVNNGGRLIILGEDSLKYDNYGNPHAAELYSDIISRSRVIPITWLDLEVTSPSNLEIKNILSEEYKNIGITKVRLIDKATGKEVNDVEFEYTEYEGHTIINIHNYNWINTPEIQIEIDGKLVESFTEMRSTNTFSGSIKVLPYEPILIKA